MALGKELINEKGVKTTYHRIDSISMVEGIIVSSGTAGIFSKKLYRWKRPSTGKRKWGVDRKTGGNQSSIANRNGKGGRRLSKRKSDCIDRRK